MTSQFRFCMFVYPDHWLLLVSLLVSGRLYPRGLSMLTRWGCVDTWKCYQLSRAMGPERYEGRHLNGTCYVKMTAEDPWKYSGMQLLCP
jgi:hypothetical protein